MALRVCRPLPAVLRCALGALLPGCLLGADALKGAPNIPTLLDAPVLVEPLPAEGETVARAGLDTRVVVELETASLLDLDAMTIGLEGAPLTFEGRRSEDGVYRWRFARTLDGTEGEGPRTLTGLLVDPRGAETRFGAALPLTTDFSPPLVAAAVLERSPAFAPADEGTGTVRFTPTDPFTGLPVSARLQVTVTEDLGAVPTLVVTGPTPLAWQVEDATARRVTWTLAEIPAVDGDHTFGLALEDDLGNRGPLAPLDVTLRVDTVGEVSPPDVDTPGRILAAQAPWGTAATGGLARVEIRGQAGAVAPRATVVVVDDLGIRASVTADGDGAFSGLGVVGDPATIRVAQLDVAGNLSPARVPRSWIWTATLGGKVRGRAYPNPHTFAETAAAGAGRTGTSEVAVPSAVAVGGTGVQTDGRARWRQRVPRPGAPTPRVVPVAAHDPVRQEVVLFGGQDAERRELADTWVWDGLTWRAMPTPAGSPGRRESAMAAFDPVREQVLLFGGRDGNSGTFLDDTWLWDGSAWTAIPLPPGGRPAPRGAGLMTTDLARSQVLLFGGEDARQDFDDTWVWDGTGWREVNLGGPRPDARFHGGMAYDAARGEVVLFGGDQWTANQPEAQTWIWDGARWRDVTDTAGTPPMKGPAQMAYDAERQVVVLRTCPFYYGDCRSGDTWEWDGRTWTKTPPVVGTIPSRHHAGVAPDPLGGVLVFGGWGNDSPQGTRDSTLLWDGRTWVQVPTTGELPLARAWAAAAWDPALRGLVWFGGSDGEFPTDATWLRHRGAWGARPRTGSLAPAPRIGHALVHDPVNEEIVLFAGSDDASSGPSGGTTIGVFDDTWTFGPDGWEERTADGPTPAGRAGHGMAFDPVTERVLLFGGIDPSAPTGPDGAEGVFGDTWAWDGVAWTRLPTATIRPVARGGAAMVADQARGEVLLFGGFDGDHSVFGDQWAWDGGAWQRRTPTSGPGPRAYAGATYDPGREAVVLFGGARPEESPDGELELTLLDDAWTWDGACWLPLVAEGTAPSGRASHVVAYADDLAEIVVFGGEAQGDDLWALDLGAGARPAHVLDVVWPVDPADGAEVDVLTVHWTAGGVGYPGGQPTPGVTLEVWDQASWREVAGHEAPPDAPAPLCWTLRAAARPAAASACTEVVDPDLLRHLMYGPGPTGHLRVVTRAPSGTGVACDAARQHARVVSGYVEVELSYRTGAR